MRIDEQRLFGFHFKVDEGTIPVVNGEITIPVRAETKDEAGEKLMKTLAKMQLDLVIDFPRVMGMPEELAKLEEDKSVSPAPTIVPPEVLELRIDTLLGDMGAAELRGKAKADTVFNWTGYKFEEANYTHIITELELIKTGQKEVPTKKPKNG